MRFSNEFIRKFAVELNWSVIAMYKRIDSDFVLQFKDFFSTEVWNDNFYGKLQLNEKQLMLIQDKVEFFDSFIKHKEISEIFVRNNKHRFKNLTKIIANIKNPSVSFLVEMREFVNWTLMIDCSLKLSEELCDEFKNELPWPIILRNFALSDRILDKFKDNIIDSFKVIYAEQSNRK